MYINNSKNVKLEKCSHAHEYNAREQLIDLSNMNNIMMVILEYYYILYDIGQKPLPWQPKGVHEMTEYLITGAAMHVCVYESLVPIHAS